MREQIVMGIDPGMTTGVAFYTFGHPKYGSSQEYTQTWRWMELGPENHHKALWNLLCREQPDRVVCESFVYQIRRLDGVDMPGIVLTSCEYIGVVKLWCESTNTPLKMQHASEVKKLWTDDKLKRLDAYKLGNSGKKHQPDATRHVLHHVVNDLKIMNVLKPLR
jgi:hypothetical protein